MQKGSSDDPDHIQKSAQTNKESLTATPLSRDIAGLKKLDSKHLTVSSAESPDIIMNPKYSRETQEFPSAKSNKATFNTMNSVESQRRTPQASVTSNKSSKQTQFAVEVKNMSSSLTSEEELAAQQRKLKAEQASTRGNSNRSQSPAQNQDAAKILYLEKIEENTNSDMEVSSRGDRSRRNSDVSHLNTRRRSRRRDRHRNSLPRLKNSDDEIHDGKRERRRRNSSVHASRPNNNQLVPEVPNTYKTALSSRSGRDQPRQHNSESGGHLSVEHAISRQSDSNGTMNSQKRTRIRRRSMTRLPQTSKPPRKDTLGKDDQAVRSRSQAFRNVASNSSQAQNQSSLMSAVLQAETKFDIQAKVSPVYVQDNKISLEHKSHSEMHSLVGGFPLTSQQTVTKSSLGVADHNRGDRSSRSSKSRHRKRSSRRMNKHGTMQMQEDSWSRRSSKEMRNYKSRIQSQQHRSISNNLSPSFNVEANMESSSNNLAEIKDEDENEVLSDSERALRKLDPAYEPPSKHKIIEQKLDNDSCSIEGNIEDVEVQDGPKVRKYLEKHSEHMKKNEWRVYPQKDVKEFKSLKQVLSRRTQFNIHKREFIYQLQKQFILHDQNSVAGNSKDHQDKGKKRGQSQVMFQLPGTSEKKKQNVSTSMSCWQRISQEYYDRMLLINDENSFIAHGKRYKFAKNSLGFLSNKNKFRIAMVWLTTWHIFDKVILSLIILNSLCLGVKDYLDPLNKTDWNKTIDSFDIYFTVAFCIECFTKIIAMGFFIGKGSYLKDAWNWLDFIVVVSSLLESYLSNVSVLRTFRLFRPLRTLNNIKSMQILVETLFASLLSLGGIMGLAVFFFTIFAILGVSQWRGLTHYRCYTTEQPVNGDWILVPDDPFNCAEGIRECPVGYCGSIPERQMTVGDLYAVDDVYRDSKTLELNYGVTNFDHLGSAFITIFQCITMEGWTTVMYIYEDVSSRILVDLYFISCVVICSFFLLNLTIAVMLREYDELEQKNSNSFHKNMIRHIGQDAFLPHALVEFVVKESNLSIGKQAKKKLKQIAQQEKTLCQQLLATEYVPRSYESHYYNNKIPRFFYAVAKSNAFGIIVMVCIILNTLVLSLDRFPEGSEAELEVLSVANMCFNIVFTAEVIIKMIGLGLIRYIRNFENIFDFLVVGMSWFELALGSEGGSSLGALRAIRLFRVFKLFKSGDLRILMDSIVFTISTIGPYIVLLMLILYVFALMGMQFFAGQFRFLDDAEGPFDLVNGVKPRHNFDKLPDALLTTFGCFIGDNWTYVMYDAMRSSGALASIYFVLVIAFGNIVMLNLFLAILLGNFDKARDFGSKRKLLMCFVDLRNAGCDLSQSIDWILEDTAEYIKLKILGWEKRIVERERQAPNEVLRALLAKNAKFMDRFDYEFNHDIVYEEETDNSQEAPNERQGEENGNKQPADKGVGDGLDPAKNETGLTFQLKPVEKEEDGEDMDHMAPKIPDMQKKRSSMTTVPAKMNMTEHHNNFYSGKKVSDHIVDGTSSYSPSIDISKPNIGVNLLGMKTITSSDHSAFQFSKGQNETGGVTGTNESKKLKGIKELNLSRETESQNRSLIQGLQPNDEKEHDSEKSFNNAFGDSAIIPLRAMRPQGSGSIWGGTLGHRDSSDEDNDDQFAIGETPKHAKEMDIEKAGENFKFERHRTMKFEHSKTKLDGSDPLQPQIKQSAINVGMLETIKADALGELEPVGAPDKEDGSDTRRQLQMIAAATQLDSQRATARANLVPPNVSGQLTTESNLNQEKIVQKKSGIWASFKSVFTSKKSTIHNKKEGQAIERVKQKFLKPSNKSVERCSEIRDLKRLIEESREYKIDREDYYMHIDLTEEVNGNQDDQMSLSARAKQGSPSYISPDVQAIISPTKIGQLSPEIKRGQTAKENERALESPDAPRVKNDFQTPSKEVRPIIETGRLDSLSKTMKDQMLSVIELNNSQSPSKMSPQKLALLRKRKMFQFQSTYTQETLIKSHKTTGSGPSLFMEKQKLSCRQKVCSKTCLIKIKNYMRDSSLFIFHKDSKIRQLCITLLKPPDNNSSKSQSPEKTFKEDMGNSGKDVMLKSVSDTEMIQLKKAQMKPIIDASETTRSLIDLKKSSQSRNSVKSSSRRSPSPSRKSGLNLNLTKRKSKRRMNRRRTEFEKGISEMSNTIKTRPNSCSNCCRKCCPSLFNTPPNKWFDNVILFLIFTSSVMLAVDSPLVDPNSSEASIYFYIDTVHTVLFTIEMMIKIIGLGFFSNNLNKDDSNKDPAKTAISEAKKSETQLKPYIWNTWNALDFFVVVSSLVELLMPLVTGGEGAESLKSLKALRALRALRPLRMVSKNEGMKLVVGALMTSIPSMTNVLLVCMLLLLILAIVGVNMFKGKFFSCQELEGEILDTIETKQDCLDAGGSWENQDINFDNVLNAMMSLFQMMTTEGWQGVMYNGMDAAGVDMQPQKDTNYLACLYFVAFMIIGSQFIINLFVGVVIDNFNKIKEKDEMGNNFVTHEQRSWIAIQKVCLAKNLVKEFSKPKGYQIFFSKITDSIWFEYTITGCIILNTIAMAMVHYGQSEGFTNFLENLNYFFAAVFNLEMILKLFAQGRNYFRQGWNVFDCFIVFGTNFGLIMKVVGTGGSMSSTTSVIRGFRIMRIFRLVKASIAIRLLIDTILNILPQIRNIMSLMGILLFIYAALGINLFSQVMLQDQLNEKNNFQTFGNAMILLMRCATGEDWNVIMYELANQEGYNDVPCREQTYQEQVDEGMMGCGSPISFIYFYSFIIIITMLIMNLAVAAVIQGLDAACQENLGIVSSDDVNQFIELWKYYDPQAKGWIGAEQLVYLLIELDPPLGRKKPELSPGEAEEEFNNCQHSMDRYLVHTQKQIVIKKVKGLAMLKDNLKLKMHQDPSYPGGYKVSYMQVLRGLLKRILSEKMKDGYKLRGEIENKMTNMWTKKHKELKTQKVHKMKLTAAELAAALIIQNWFKKKKRSTLIMPEKKKASETTRDLLKNAQRKLAMQRLEGSQYKGLSKDQQDDKKHSGMGDAQKQEREKEEMKEENDQIDTGLEILQIISRVGERGVDRQGKRLEENTRIKLLGHGNYEIKKVKRQNPNLRPDDDLTWHDKVYAEKLFEEVKNEERQMKKLRSAAANQATLFDNHTKHLHNLSVYAHQLDDDSSTSSRHSSSAETNIKGSTGNADVASLDFQGRPRSSSHHTGKSNLSKPAQKTISQNFMPDSLQVMQVSDAPKRQASSPDIMKNQAEKLADKTSNTRIDSMIAAALNPVDKERETSKNNQHVKKLQFKTKQHSSSFDSDTSDDQSATEDQTAQAIEKGKPSQKIGKSLFKDVQATASPKSSLKDRSPVKNLMVKTLGFKTEVIDGDTALKIPMDKSPSPGLSSSMTPAFQRPDSSFTAQQRKNSLPQSFNEASKKE